MRLRVESGGLVSEKTEQHTLPLVLTSGAAKTCVLDGYAAVALFDRQGRLLPFRYTHRGDQMITGARPKPIQLRPGASAYFALNQNTCASFTTRTASTLRIRLAGGHGELTMHLARYPILGYCGRGVWQTVAVSPFERQQGGWVCRSQGSCARRGG